MKRARNGEGLGLPRRSEPMEMGIWDIKSGQGRNALFYLNSSRSAVGAYLCLVSGHYCRLGVASAESGCVCLHS